MATPTVRPRPSDSVQFDIWGCRGSRNFVPNRSKIGNRTACYSLLVGEDLYVIDAGRGLAALGHAVRTQSRFKAVERVHVLVSHAHMDHWEGLKDADWFWYRGNGLRVTIWAVAQALDAIRAGHAHPSYVPLELLAEGTLSGLTYSELKANSLQELPGVALKTSALNHYSGQGFSRRPLETLGFRLEVRGDGPVVCYLSDHEPTEQTLATELAMLTGAHLAVYDAHFPDIKRQAHGHGSQEHSANMARRHPQTVVLAGHHGPMFSDREIRETHRGFARGLPNFQLAVEGATYTWDRRQAAFRSSGRAKASRLRHVD
jgi:phosphoribosyl 1,2-cyclic phosphodiesterase